MNRVYSVMASCAISEESQTIHATLTGAIERAIDLIEDHERHVLPETSKDRVREGFRSGDIVVWGGWTYRVDAVQVLP